jgi:hypothetical protein
MCHLKSSASGMRHLANAISDTSLLFGTNIELGGRNGGAYSASFAIRTSGAIGFAIAPYGTG